jgi:hypothetical protein
MMLLSSDQADSARTAPAARAGTTSIQLERIRRAEAERLGLDPETATWAEIEQAQVLYMQRLRAGQIGSGS